MLKPEPINRVGIGVLIYFLLFKLNKTLFGVIVKKVELSPIKVASKTSLEVGATELAVIKTL